MRAAVVGMVLLCFLGCSGRDASLEKERLELERQRLDVEKQRLELQQLQAVVPATAGDKGSLAETRTRDALIEDVANQFAAITVDAERTMVDKYNSSAGNFSPGMLVPLDEIPTGRHNDLYLELRTRLQQDTRGILDDEQFRLTLKSSTAEWAEGQSKRVVSKFAKLISELQIKTGL